MLKKKMVAFRLEEDLLMACKYHCLEVNMSFQDYLHNLIYNDYRTWDESDRGKKEVL